MLLSGYSQLNREMNSIVEEQQPQKIDLLTLLKSWISQGLVASKWCLDRSRASHFSQQIGLRNKKLHDNLGSVWVSRPEILHASSWCHCLYSAKKKFGNPKQSLKPPGIPYHIYNMGGGGAWGHVKALISLMHEGKTCIYRNPLFLLYIVIHGLFFIHCHPQTSIVIYALFYSTFFQFPVSLGLYETQPDISHDGTQTSKHQAAIYNRE